MPEDETESSSGSLTFVKAWEGLHLASVGSGGGEGQLDLLLGSPSSLDDRLVALAVLRWLDTLPGRQFLLSLLW